VFSRVAFTKVQGGRVTPGSSRAVPGGIQASNAALQSLPSPPLSVLPRSSSLVPLCVAARVKWQGELCRQEPSASHHSQILTASVTEFPRTPGRFGGSGVGGKQGWGPLWQCYPRLWRAGRWQCPCCGRWLGSRERAWSVQGVLGSGAPCPGESQALYREERVSGWL